MPDSPESKPHFWSSLPGILTGIGGLIAALTGLMLAWNQMSSKPISSDVPPVNAIATLASAPGASPSNADNDRYKSLVGRWEVTAKGSCFEGLKEATWDLDATVSGNVLTLQGKIDALNGNPNLDENTKKIRAAFVITMNGLGGIGDLKETLGGLSQSYDVSLRLDDDQRSFRGTVGTPPDPPCSLIGSKV